MKRGYNRRDFLKVVGATSGLAAAGCSEDLPEKLIPYVVQPDEIIPGKSAWYSGTCTECSAGCGVMVRVREGRALKSEGNPRHPINAGALCATGQAAIQAHYDPDRVREPLRRDPNGSFAPVSWKDAIAASSEALKGSGATVVVTQPLSGSAATLFKDFLSKIPNARHFEVEFSDRESLNLAATELFGLNCSVRYDFSAADVVLGIGADYLETWLSPVEYSRQWAARRDPANKAGMSYVVQVEPRLSLTAANADKWLLNKPGSEGALLQGILAELLATDCVSDNLTATVRAAVGSFALPDAARATGLSVEALRELVKKLASSNSSLVVVGGSAVRTSQSVELFKLGHLVNLVLGNIGRTVLIGSAPERGNGLAQFLSLLNDWRSGKVKVENLMISGVNIAYNLPPDSGLTKLISQSRNVIVLSTHQDETADLGNILLPISSSFESWSDGEPAPGVWNLNQPAMQPLYQTQSFGDTILALAVAMQLSLSDVKNFHEYIKSQWKRRTGEVGFESRWLGYVEQGGDFAESAPKGVSVNVKGTLAPVKFSQPDGFSLLAYASIHSFDGRNANRAWMQELPHPITSSVWGSFIEIHPSTAAKFGLAKGDVAQIQSASGTIEAPVYITKYIHPDLVAVPLGQGHQSYGRFAQGVGANPVKVCATSSAAVALLTPLVKDVPPIRKTTSVEKLVVTQGSDTEFGRGIVRSVGLSKLSHSQAEDAHLSHSVAKAHSAEEGHGEGHGGHHALGPQPAPAQMYEQMHHPLYQWGMTVDLNSCTGCSACVIACFAENNVPVVGKQLVDQGREMSWIRMDRYFDGPEEHPITGFMPMFCQHCNNAPCEPVCPVYATYHNEDGLNLMAYNRCVGTRYCLNNCSYKVRRFNFFKYNWPEPLTWQLNPDVTVREVGIMEKCSFCVQRIAEGKNNAKNLGRQVLDGEITPACVATCPTKALTFGNLKDSHSEVYKKSQSQRSYKVLDQHINTQPAVSYLAKVTHDEGGHA